MCDTRLSRAPFALVGAAKHKAAHRLCIYIALFTLAVDARGDFFTASVYVSGSGRDPSGQEPNFVSVTRAGETSAAAAASYSGFLNGHQSATAAAAAEGSVGSLLSGRVLATSDQAGGYTPAGIARAIASWSDTLRIGGAGFAGGEFLFRFEVEGLLSGATGISWQGGGYAEMTLGGPGGRAFGTGIYLDNYSGAITTRKSSWSYSNFPFDWESYQVTTIGDGNYAFRGTATFVQYLFPDYDNPISAELRMDSWTWDAVVAADFGSTVRFTSMQLGDGRTPEAAGYSISFGSGLASPNGIPEPTSLTLSMLAVAMSAAYASRPRPPSR